MVEIRANHYTDLMIYSVEQTVTKIKSDLNQYIMNLGIGITAEQFSVLDTIYCSKNICQQDVATILSKDKSNVKRIVEILKNKELITISLSKRNNYAVNFLNITEKGKKLIDDNVQNIKTHLATIFEDISEDEVQVLKIIIQKLNAKESRIKSNQTSRKEN